LKIDIGDVTLHVRDTGTGEPVVLLHGWPDTGDLWAHQSTALEASGYRVIAPDLRGFGASSKPTDIGAYAAPAQVGDVVGVLDALQIPRAHVVGHDWGAAIAWMTAAFAPARVTSVTALSVGHPSSFGASSLRQRQLSWYMLLFQFPGIAEQWLSADDFRNFREWSSHPQVDSVVDRLAEPGAIKASLGIYRANLPPESLVAPPTELPPVTVPAMGVWSSEDLALTEENMVNSAKYMAAPWRYERVEGAGHWLQLDAPDKVNALLLDFLGGVPTTDH
jgi:pimeloyl-ACP methyl ester carboxylesterase